MSKGKWNKPKGEEVKREYIKIYCSKETKEKAVKQYGKMNLTYAINKLVQKDLNEGK